MQYPHIREEELKNKVAQAYFDAFDCTQIIGNIDFCVALPAQTAQGQLYETQSFLWAEAKKGASDTYKSIAQLILTIGKARTFDKQLPPAFLGAFDGEKIAFLPYNAIQEVFYQNDFNWNVTPSNHDTREFRQVLEAVRTHIDAQSLMFVLGRDDKEIRTFVQENFVAGKAELSKIKIDKNNFVPIYNKWRATVMPSIGVNWEVMKKMGIIDGDFYLADLLSRENETLKDKLFVLLRGDQYQLERKQEISGLFSTKSAGFIDKQRAHTLFWNKYERPPKEEYWAYIVGRRDLLVPQDVRERKGSFFTPQIWVELSQRYLADVLGEDWQDEYYIWDCAAGTGNLLAGLTNKYHIWASTLDRQDVDVMHDRVANGANLLDEHVFQFDFLNDDFSKLPQSLQTVINSPEKRKKLIVYINPPYAEHGNRTTITAQGEHKASVATINKVHAELHGIVGTATRELFVQFLLRAYKDIPECVLAFFGTMKFVSSQNFSKFRQYFKASYEKGFICKANTFDNVTGNFPIAFTIWNTSKKQGIGTVETDIAITDNAKIFSWTEGKKSFYTFSQNDFISVWLRLFYDKVGQGVGHLILPGADMQQQNGVYITSSPTESDIKQHKTTVITKNNLAEMCVYLSIRQVIELTWLNNRDQFLFPHEDWAKDSEFKNDCLAYALFHGQNKVTSNGDANHWIPFRAQDVNARAQFQSDFMYRYLAGKLPPSEAGELFAGASSVPTSPVQFSTEAQAVFSAGKALWQYYHAQPSSNPDASLYDIKDYFQGRNAQGKMNNRSDNDDYTRLLACLRDALKVLAKKIAPKVYEYGFLKG